MINNDRCPIPSDIGYSTHHSIQHSLYLGTTPSPNINSHILRDGSCLHIADSAKLTDDTSFYWPGKFPHHFGKIPSGSKILRCPDPGQFFFPFFYSILICIEIFGYRNKGTRDYAIALGVALQLTNIIRDVSIDFRGGRVYLPQEDLRRFQVTGDDLAFGISDRVADLLAFECERAQSFYTKSKDVLPLEDSRRLVAAEIMSGIYYAILERIKKRRYDVFSEVVRVPRSRRALIAARVWVRVMLSGSSM